MERARAGVWQADIHKGHVVRNRVCDLVGHSSGPGIARSTSWRIRDCGNQALGVGGQ